MSVGPCTDTQAKEASKLKQWQLWDYPVEVDRTATKEWYEQSEGWSCECGDCQNFLALAKKGLLPSSVTEILLPLGVLPEKPTYVCTLSPTDAGHLYQFSYRIAGNMADDPDLEDDAVLPPNFPDKPSSNDDIYQNAGGASVVGEAVAYMGLPSAGLEQTRSLLRNVADKVESTKTYHQRCGGFYDCAYDGKDLKNVWVSPIYSYAEADSPYHYEADISGLEAGFDVQSDVYNRLGVFASYRHGEYDFDGRGDDYYSKTGAETEIDSYILGLYHRYDRGRYWLMSSLFAGYEDVDMASQDGVKASTDGLVFGGGIMGGTVYALGNNLTLEPTLGAIYTQIDYDNVKDRYGKEAHYGKLRNLELEASLKLQKTYYRKDGFALVYLRPGVVQNIGSGDVRVTSLQKVDALENSTLGSLKAGGSLSLNENWSAYFEIGYLFGSGYKNAMMNAGLVYAF